ncbi:MAG: bifunctional precorrin-2 dehydrogenase/sirohydrochlorin ferrochelatase [Deltaproteobacteria bacterium]|jgi:precorrin-2 dehydrogenase/sirohydrochlorin ferrochelatase|nr:bifunctional precorrin-2 dehydrogenase/sirohydrochlorin ferrochelatase [Deltaproteobacteria bacterium]
MSFYPVCLDLEAKHCVVVGGGKVAERKVLGLLSCAAQVAVVSPELTEELQRLHTEGDIEWLSREYRPGDLEQAFLVIAATDDEETQKQVFEEAAGRNLLLNVADVPQRCNFILPATVRQGDLAVSVSTAGKSPALARKIRMELEKRYGPEYSLLVKILGAVRPEVLASGLEQSENERLFKKLLHDDMPEWIRNGNRDRLETHLLEVLGDRIGNDWLPVVRSLLDAEKLN